MKMPKSPRFNVDVTKEIIQASASRDSSHCMIAEAVRAAYPGAQFVAVDIQTIRFTDRPKGLRFTYLTPRQAQVALVKFDQGQVTDPFRFQQRAGQVTKAGRNRVPRATTDSREASDHDNLRKARLVQGDRIRSV